MDAVRTGCSISNFYTLTLGHKNVFLRCGHLVSYSFNLCPTTQVDKLHIWKKNFFWKFFWDFLSIYYVVLAQIQKNQYVLKTSKSCLFGTVNIYLIWRFVSILLQFSKKKHIHKFFFQKIFFQLFRITFSKHN